ncbi:MAG: hypothetical protein WBE57_07830, partial [Xanthobacteraceae bacterium]
LYGPKSLDLYGPKSQKFRPSFSPLSRPAWPERSIAFGFGVSEKDTPEGPAYNGAMNTFSGAPLNQANPLSLLYTNIPDSPVLDDPCNRMAHAPNHGCENLRCSYDQSTVP